MAESRITPRNQDFAAWYQDVVLQGDMAEPAEIVKGDSPLHPLHDEYDGPGRCIITGDQVERRAVIAKAY